MKCVNSRVLDKQPDCLITDSDSNLLVAYYNLDDPATQAKSGGFHILSPRGNEVLTSFDAGLLDFKLIQHGQTIGCFSDGTVRLVSYSEEGITEQGKLQALNNCGTYISVLDTQVAVSSSGGELALIDIPTLDLLRKVKIGDYECWFTEQHRSGTFVSTGSNLAFLPYNEADYQSIKTSHSSEICSFLMDEFSLITGDFAGVLKYSDIRTGACVSTHQLATAGIWRFRRWEDWLIAACMQDGLHCYHPTSQRSVSDHSQSLVYGLDLTLLASIPHITSCSFYDRLLTTWQFSPTDVEIT